jgi:hypothetical protein
MSFLRHAWRSCVESVLRCVGKIKLVEKKRRKKPFLDER